MSKWNKIKEIHPNSVNAYWEGRLDNSFSKRERLIMSCLRDHNEPMTDRQILEDLELPDMNAVRPRITELIKDAGILEECGTRIDDCTGKPVRKVRIKTDDDRQLNLFN